MTTQEAVSHFLEGINELAGLVTELERRVDYLSDRLALVEGSQRRLEQYVGRSTGAGPSEAVALGEDWYYADCNEDADPGGDAG